MKPRKWVTLGGAMLGAVGVSLVAKSFLPQRFPTADWHGTGERTSPLDSSTYPAVDVTFLRCGSITIPKLIAVRGAPPFARCVIAYSAVLVRHPRATFLYDTGFCSDIYTFLVDKPLLFRKTLGKFTFEQSLGNHLKHAGGAKAGASARAEASAAAGANTRAEASAAPTICGAGSVDFALLSHLHWDHVSGIPDIPGVLLRVNRVEYEAARLGLFEANGGLVRQLMGDNPVECFDCTGPSYEGFRSSYDLFGDGSIVLVPLPGHTAGNTGMFINRSNGARLFLLGDAAWVSQNYTRPATMHPWMWSVVTSDDATARQTLIELHRFWLQHPEVSMLAMHDAEMQEQFMARTQAEFVLR